MSRLRAVGRRKVFSKGNRNTKLICVHTTALLATITAKYV